MLRLSCLGLHDFKVLRINKILSFAQFSAKFTILATAKNKSVEAIVKKVIAIVLKINVFMCKKFKG